MSPAIRWVVLLVIPGLVPAPTPGQSPDVAGQSPRLVDPVGVQRAAREAYGGPVERVGLGGVVRLRVLVNEEGRADSMEVVSSTGRPALDNAARTALRHARFEPAAAPDGPVPGWTEVALRFGTREPRVDRELTYSGGESALIAATALYPEELKAKSMGVEISVGFIVDGTGAVLEHAVLEPSCFPEADVAALSATRELEFEARTGRTADRFVTVATVSFMRRTAGLRVRGDRVTPNSATECTLPDVLTGETADGNARPRLHNRSQVQHAMNRHYPSDLRERGIGGSAEIWMDLDREGKVTYRMVHRSSGRCELDRAALEVAGVMRFSPATIAGEAVPITVSLSIGFETK
jgi:TonB family protein